MSEHQDGFYVGYLPMPRRHLVFLWIMTPLVAAALGSLAGVFSAAQRDPGDGVWDTGSPVTVTGTLLAEPYPMVVDDEGRTHLLVNVGKTAPNDRAAPLAGQRVEATGYSLQREGRRMLELLDGEAGLTATGGAARSVEYRDDHRSAAVVGEILDSKCYLGAMKPGDGKGHKACATLCIEGGIPPLLLWQPITGEKHHYLLIDAEGQSAAAMVLDVIGEPVAVIGRLGWIGDQQTLTIRTGDVERWTR